MAELDSIVKEFLVESYENLDQLDRDLVALEKDPHDRGRLASVFRTIHTIKGTCGFFGFSTLESVAHVGENLLSRLRDGVLLLDPERTSALLALVDAVRTMLANIENTGSDGNGDYGVLVATLTRLQEENTPTPATPAAAPQQSAPEMAKPTAPVAAAKPAKPTETPRPAESKQNAPAETTPAENRGGGVSEGNVRVDVGLLDKLMNLVGELVLARNQILQYTATQKDTTFLSTTQRLNLITTELQEGVMKTRMQPINNLWSRFPRVVRDLSVACGKQVWLEMEGQETELDRTILEAIKDPLTHIIRNSVDHGVEPPDRRTARGKSAEGCLLLRAFHEGGQVNIEITDDGGGIDPERVRNKALERGLITRDQAARMSDREATQLIFLPGFSTAEKVSNISGRGVGMDVVKTNIEKIGGTVDIQSQIGKGTTLKVKIPLTLAIIPALVVTTGGDRYAIPQVSLLELVRLEGEQALKGIEYIHGAPVYRLRGRLLPLVHLRGELGLGAAPEDEVTNIVVLQADERQFGLVVEGINDTEEIVVKPLSKHLKGIPLFAGATIMGDGRVALILDVLGIAQRSRVVSEVRDRALAELASRSQERGDDQETMLLLGLGRDGRLAVPLSLVARLEEIPAQAVETADGSEVVQYRDQIMPLLRLSRFLPGVGGLTDASQDPMQVVVYTHEGRSVGLVVDRILDIVETRVDIKRSGGRPGILGSAVIQQRVTDLLDVPTVVASAL